MNKWTEKSGGARENEDHELQITQDKMTYFISNLLYRAAPKLSSGNDLDSKIKNEERIFAEIYTLHVTKAIMNEEEFKLPLLNKAIKEAAKAMKEEHGTKPLNDYLKKFENIVRSEFLKANALKPQIIYDDAFDQFAYGVVEKIAEKGNNDLTKEANDSVNFLKNQFNDQGYLRIYDLLSNLTRLPQRNEDLAYNSYQILPTLADKMQEFGSPSQNPSRRGI